MNRIILALDTKLDINVVRGLREVIDRVKFSYITLLEGGFEYLKAVREIGWEEVIFDLKLADIDSTMIGIVSKLLPYSDSFISHAFIGLEGALGPLSDFLKGRGKGLYLVLSMSHKGWSDEFYPYLRRIAENLDPKGFVVGATKPEMIKRVRDDFRDKLIISPGVGVQGANIGDAICNGADFEIIGRSIYSSNDPIKTAYETKKKLEERLSECKIPKNR